MKSAFKIIWFQRLSEKLLNWIGVAVRDRFEDGLHIGPNALAGTVDATRLIWIKRQPSIKRDQLTYIRCGEQLFEPRGEVIRRTASRK